MTKWTCLSPLLLLGALVPQTGAPSTLANSRECNPCHLKTQPADGPPQDLAVWLEPKPTDSGGRRVESLRLQSAEAGEVRLPVTPEMDVRPRQSFVLDASDINFDGVGDLMLVVSSGTSNVEAQYWVFDPRARRYVDAGVFPELRVDPAHHQLTSHEDDGEAGQLFHDAVYAWREGKLVKIREVTQTYAGHPGTLTRITSEIRDGRLTVTSQAPVASRQ